MTLRRNAQSIHLGTRKRIAGFLLGVVAMALRALASLRAKSSRNVLMLEPFGMGDVVSYQPLVHRLQASGCDVRICARAEWRPLYPQIVHWVPARIPWSSYAEQAKYSLGEYTSQPFRQFLRELRSAARGAIGVDTRGDIRSVILLYLAGCRRVVTLSNYLGTDLNNFAGAAWRVPFHSELRRWELNLCFLPVLNADSCGGSAAGPKFPHLARARAPLAARRLGLVAIAPWKGKWWGQKRWSEFVAKVRAAGWEVTGLCGPGQETAARGELGEGVEVMECGSVEDWAEKLQGFSAVVTVDTGPMHLADALGVPVIALFGQGLLPLWAPSGAESRVLSHQGDADFVLCHPIERNTPAGQEFMGRIEAVEVLKALEELAKTGGPQG